MNNDLSSYTATQLTATRDGISTALDVANAYAEKKIGHLLKPVNIAMARQKMIDVQNAVSDMSVLKVKAVADQVNPFIEQVLTLEQGKELVELLAEALNFSTLVGGNLYHEKNLPLIIGLSVGGGLLVIAAGIGIFFY